TTPEVVNVTIDTAGQAAIADFGWMEEGGGELASISGVVFDDTNGDGVQDEGELGLSGMRVGLQGAAILEVTTDADGAYAFADLGMGEYTVKSFGPPGWVATTPEVVNVTIDTAGQAAIADFGWMEEGGGELASIGGVVFEDVNNNGVQDEGELGLAGLRVGLQGAATAEATTDADGAYAFADLGMGEYTVKSFGPNAYMATTPEVVNVTIDTAGQAETVDFGWQAYTGNHP
ncbi:MAG: SdrD B-like domain-containing protein, partial [Candidatus Krumholzibacteriota bacterium]